MVVKMRIGIETLGGSLRFLGIDGLTDARHALDLDEKSMLLAAKKFDATLPWCWICYASTLFNNGTHYFLVGPLDIDFELKVAASNEEVATRQRIIRTL